MTTVAPPEAKRKSLARQLYLRLSAVVVVGFGVFVVALMVEFSLKAVELEQTSLLGIAQRIADAPVRYEIAQMVTEGRTDVAGLTVRRMSGEFLIKPDRWAVDVAPGATFVYDDHDFQYGHDLRTGERLFAVSVNLDGATVGRAGERLLLQVARPAVDLDPIIMTFIRVNLEEMWWIFALILVVTLFVVRLTINRAMRAVTMASEQAAAIAPDEIDRRLPVEGLPTEIAPLAQRVNDALDRLETGYRAERAFTASAAHELRTPLSVLRAKIEQAPAGEARTQALDHVDRMARLVGQLLQLTRVETWRGNPEDAADALDVCRQVTSDLSPAIVERGGDVELVAPNAPCGWQVDRILLEIVLRNLIENAIRYADGPPVLRITVAPTSLVVEDAGPGIPEQDRQRVFEVFWRRDSSRGDGAGIGLALVARIAARLDCGVRIDTSNLGGAAVTLSRAAA